MIWRLWMRKHTLWTTLLVLMKQDLDQDHDHDPRQCHPQISTLETIQVYFRLFVVAKQQIDASSLYSEEEYSYSYDSDINEPMEPLQEPLHLPHIEIIPWKSDKPYIRELETIGTTKNMYSSYIKMTKNYTDQPHFYMDAGNILAKYSNKTLAHRIFTNISEIDLSNPQFMRMLAYILEKNGELDLAIDLYERIWKLR
jgi:hypothetical protein